MSEPRRPDVHGECVNLRSYFEALRQNDLASIEAWRKEHIEHHRLMALALDREAETTKARFDAANEWRSTVTDIMGKAASKEWAESKIESIYIRLDSIERRLTSDQGAKEERSNQQDRKMWLIGTIIAIVSIVASLFARTIIK